MNELIKNFELIGQHINNFKSQSNIKEWNSFELDFSIPLSKKSKVENQIKKQIPNYKELSGFYAIFKNDECLYIGTGKQIWERIKSHYRASQGKEKSKRWADFFGKHRDIVKIYWLEYDKLENTKQSQKLRELIENILELKYRPKFEYEDNAPQQ